MTDKEKSIPGGNSEPSLETYRKWFAQQEASEHRYLKYLRWMNPCYARKRISQRIWSDLLDKERREAIQVIISAASIITATFAAIGLVATVNNAAEERKQSEKRLNLNAERLELDSRRFEDDKRLTQERLITDRFTKAASLLESKDRSVRIAAIFALERIAIDSPKDHWTIMELLSAYVREKSPLLIQEKTAISVSYDVQAVLTVIGRRGAVSETIGQKISHYISTVSGQQTSQKNYYDREIDLRNTNLSKANLIGANLSGADLRNTNLNGADLRNTNLSKANLIGATLSGADLRNTNLSDAVFSNANVHSPLPNPYGPQQKGLIRANLSKADLREANLSRANLIGANLSSAFLNEANLSKSNVSGANLNSAELISANLSDATFFGTNLSSAKLSDAKLKRTICEFCDFRNATFFRTDLSGADVSDADFRGAIFLHPDQIKGANSWRYAKYNDAMREKLGLPSETSAN
ncbi:pentapeptide repeat-containing protein [Acaryochloris marina NIES-2412]|uniref:pentapeptide repeat-containing protein n=1 Tax=Acaryochloris marina TaxID=155978 RepID=UPI0040587F74